MDDIVKAAMAKWPQVPDCVGWLGLDARGDWWMRDERAQAAGPFAGVGANPASKGSRLQHRQLIDFIGRNYAADAQGRWFFQNGPQRVFVELAVAPWVWRVNADGTLCSHTGQAAAYRSCCLDEQGRLFVHTDLGLGLVHSLDMWTASECVATGRWLPDPCPSETLPQRYGFVPSPQQAQRAAQA
jgi:hypothetical protein